jgi:hypothetical protein
MFIKRTLLLLSVFLITGIIGNLLAMDMFAEAKVTIKVLDEAGNSVENASVGIGFLGSKGENSNGKSDKDGFFTAQSPAQDGEFAFSVKKDGYYNTNGREMIKNSNGNLEQNGGKWQPWNPTYEVVLKKIINPVPMYAKRCNLGLPEFNKKIGFDLEKGEWVAPYGKGIIPDLVFLGELNRIDSKNFDYKLTVSFSNPGDGIYPFEAQYKYGSTLKSSQQAPLAEYKPEWVQTRSRKPGKYETGNSDDKRNYYFRVRSKTDENGNIVQATYGKIYGDFLDFTYYFNPDGTRNLEFDPKQNLLIPPGKKYAKEYNACINLSP